MVALLRVERVLVSGLTSELLTHSCGTIWSEMRLRCSGSQPVEITCVVRKPIATKETIPATSQDSSRPLTNPFDDPMEVQTIYLVGRQGSLRGLGEVRVDGWPNCTPRPSLQCKRIWLGLESLQNGLNRIRLPGVSPEVLDSLFLEFEKAVLGVHKHFLDGEVGLHANGLLDLNQLIEQIFVVHTRNPLRTHRQHDERQPYQCVNSS